MCGVGLPLTQTAPNVALDGMATQITLVWNWPVGVQSNPMAKVSMEFKPCHQRTHAIKFH